MDREEFGRDIGKVMSKHGMEGAVISYRDGVSLVTLVVADDPVWYAGLKVLGETFSNAANTARVEMAEAMMKEVTRITAGN